MTMRPGAKAAAQVRPLFRVTLAVRIARELGKPTDPESLLRMEKARAALQNAAIHAEAFGTSHTWGAMQVRADAHSQPIARQIASAWDSISAEHELDLLPELELTESDRIRLTRPDLSRFDYPSGEFYRWYEHGGKQRPRPLDLHELARYLQDVVGWSRETAMAEAESSGAGEGDKELWRLLEAEPPPGRLFSWDLRLALLAECFRSDDEPLHSDSDATVLRKWFIHCAKNPEASPVGVPEEHRLEFLDLVATCVKPADLVVLKLIDELTLHASTEAGAAEGLSAELFEDMMQKLADAVELHLADLPIAYQPEGWPNPYAQHTTASRLAMANSDIGDAEPAQGQESSRSAP